VKTYAKQQAKVATVGLSVPRSQTRVPKTITASTADRANRGKTFTDIPADSIEAAQLSSTLSVQEKLPYGLMTYTRWKPKDSDSFAIEISFSPSYQVACNDIAFVQSVKHSLGLRKTLPRKLRKHAATSGATIDQSEAQLSPFYTVNSSLFSKWEDKGPALPDYATAGIPGKGGVNGWPAVMLDAPVLPKTTAIFESCAICRGDRSRANTGSVYGCVVWMFVGDEEGVFDTTNLPIPYFTERESHDFSTAGAAWNKWQRKHRHFGRREAMPDLHAPPSLDEWASMKTGGPLLQRKCSCDGACDDCDKKKLRRSTADKHTPTQVPDVVHQVLRSSGKPLDQGTRESMEGHFLHDFSSVRIHSNSAAAESARLVDAEAYTVGRHIVFGSDSVPAKILAHELAHVVQNGGGDQTPTAIGAAHGPEEVAADRASENWGTPVHLSHASRGTVNRYRSKNAFNFGVDDHAPLLVEQEFVDAQTQPWIERVNVHFNGTTNDSKFGQTIPTGTATAHYAANNAKLADFSLPVAGGNPWIGLTDRGTFPVHRLEGVGYSDRYLGEAGEGPHRKYVKADAGGDRSSSMHYAVFFHGGQALHQGNLTVGSHGCVHFGSGIQQINYHSVKKWKGVTGTHVEVSYDAAALAKPCCERMEHLGITRKGGALNPCDKADPKACPQAAPSKGGGR
jgi:Domain of unknown function (DUF4157)